MSDYKRAKTAVSVPYGEARHVAEPAGAVIRVADTAQFLQDQFAEGNGWLATLFEDATLADYEAYTGFVAKLAEEEKAEEAAAADPEPEKEEPEAAEEPEPNPIRQQRRRSRKVQKEDEAA